MEKIWYDDPRHFVTQDNYYCIWPSKDMSFAQQLNCLMRFSIYFAIIVFLIKKDPNILFIPIFMGIFTYYIYMVDTQNKKTEREMMENMNVTKDTSTGKTCQKPTSQNPFMNVLMSEYAQNPKRVAACTMNNKVKKQVNQYFDANLYRDVDDIFHKNASDRQFYTTANTTIPNDQTTFAKWLYDVGPTCKEGNGEKCYMNMNRGANV